MLAPEMVLGNPVHPVSRALAVDSIVDRALAGQPGAYVCLTNAHTTVESHHLEELRSAIGGAFLSVPDGMPIVWLLRRRGHRQTEKVTGVELMPKVAARGRPGLRHLLYGGGPGVAKSAADALVRRVPGTEVVAALAPPFSSGRDLVTDQLREHIRVGRPHILWVGLGAPKQELWMANLAGELAVPVMIGVGAAFDFLSGNKREAPRVLRHGGLEWLFRLLSEPRRLWRRYLVGNSEFLYLLARQSMTNRGRTPRGANRRGPW